MYVLENLNFYHKVDIFQASNSHYKIGKVSSNTVRHQICDIGAITANTTICAISLYRYTSDKKSTKKLPLNTLFSCVLIDSPCPMI